MFQDAGRLFFSETLLCGTLPISLRPRSHRLRGGINPSGYTLTVDGLQVFQYSLFRRESLLALLSVKRAASYVAFKMVRCNVYVLCWCVFPHPLSLAYGNVSQYLVCSFVLGILVQIIHSATPFLFTCLRCILHVRLCCSAFVLRARLCAL